MFGDKIHIASKANLKHVASKFSTCKSHLPLEGNVDSKKVLPRNSFVTVNFLGAKSVFIKILLLFVRLNIIPYGLRHFQCRGPYDIVFSQKTDNYGVGWQKDCFWALTLATWAGLFKTNDVVS